MPSQKIRIEETLKMLRILYGLTEEEIKCTTIKKGSHVEDALVIEVHNKLKEIIEKHCQKSTKNKSIEFTNSTNNGHSLILIRPKANGYHHWDMIFQTILKGIFKEKHSAITSQKNSIKDALEKILRKVNADESLTSRIVFKSGIFRASIFVEGLMIRFENADAEVVKKLIESKLPALIKVLIPKKNQ